MSQTKLLQATVSDENTNMHKIHTKPIKKTSKNITDMQNTKTY